MDTTPLPILIGLAAVLWATWFLVNWYDKGGPRSS